MKLSDADRQTILDFLKSGNRQAALDFIIRTYRASRYDSEQLLKAFEKQYLPGLAKKFDAATCSGCLSSILKVIAIIVGILGIIIFMLGYFFVELFGHNFTYRKVPVVVTGFSYRYDSLYVNLIYEYKDGGQIKIDTGTIEYDTAVYHVGDTTQVYGSDLGLGPDDDALRSMHERQQLFYWVGAGVFIVALVFWIASVTFKVRPPTAEQGRYAR